MTTTEPADKQTLATRLIETLEERKELRGFMAVLRRAAAEVQPLRAYQAFSHLPNGVHDPAVQAVAILYSRHALHSETNRNLGKSLAEVVTKQFPRNEKNGIMVSTFDTRFNRLMTARNFNEIQTLLLRAWPLLARNSIPVDYKQLYRDLRDWSEDSGYFDDKKRDAVKIKWAKTYWGASEKKMSPEEKQV